MTTFTFDASIVSDLHKDARGFRPTEYFWEEWSQVGDAGRQQIWDVLCKEFDQEQAREAAADAAAINAFEQLIAATIQAGAGDAATATRWVVDAEDLTEHDLQYGADYLCYHFHLPYSEAHRFAIIFE